MHFWVSTSRYVNHKLRCDFFSMNAHPYWNLSVYYEEHGSFTIIEDMLVLSVLLLLSYSFSPLWASEFKVRSCFFRDKSFMLSCLMSTYSYLLSFLYFLNHFIHVFLGLPSRQCGQAIFLIKKIIPPYPLGCLQSL